MTDAAVRAPGTLVHLRGREWVVLPPADDPAIQLLRPLGGTDVDVIGIDRELEGADLADATLPPPDPSTAGDAISANLLRDAVRLGFRSAAGPFRSLGRIDVEPRTYQLVPLLMALRLDPVRLLIADDVGIGKTIEAGLIARELLDRGEIRRLAVLCPPHLCEQWQKELRERFHFDAVIVRPGTVAALERQIEREVGIGATSIFQHFSVQVISIDYIKSDRRRDDFVRQCPECIVVDEAHGVSETGNARGVQQQRHRLIADLAKRPDRHVIFTTASPHSGDQSAFASLIGLLVPELRAAVADLEYGGGTEARARLARHFVQRRRADIRTFLDDATTFPDRQTRDETYALNADYLKLLSEVLAYARQLVSQAAVRGEAQRRFTWWTAIALLRCAGSSPAAAAAALRTRARVPESATAAEVDAAGAASVLDLGQSDAAASDDTTPGADLAPDESEEASPATADRARLLRMARAADALAGAGDPKLSALVPIVQGLLKDGFAPIVFCRYISTAGYVARELRERLGGDVDVRAVTGELPPDEREAAVTALGESRRRVLVATDCLSEGVNLQKHFTAVIHYDLAWNPTRHEQREGRVDRYGQPAGTVRAVTFYGRNNRVDGAVLEVLIRKAETIRRSTGVAVPVPEDVDRVLEAIFDRLFTSGSTDYAQLELFADLGGGRQSGPLGAAEAVDVALDRAWQSAAERESRTRAIFAQNRLRPEEIAADVRAARAAIGSGADVDAWLFETLQRFGATLTRRTDGALVVDAASVPAVVRRRLDWADLKTVTLAFQPSAASDALYVPRTHPIVERLGAHLLETALESPSDAIARRVGAVRTRAVATRTLLLLRRVRYVIATAGRELLVEEVDVAGVRGEMANPSWLDDDDALNLAADAPPAGNVATEQRARWVTEALSALPRLEPALIARTEGRAQSLLEQHRRVRAVTRGPAATVRPVLPTDLLGCYVLMPPAMAL